MINIKTDSRKVKKGDTFIAIKGNTVDGHDYIEKAIENGASKIVCEHGSYNAETIVVPDTKEYLQKYIVDNYKDIVNELDIIGVTGTNGKTTTTSMIYNIISCIFNSLLQLSVKAELDVAVEIRIALVPATE